jgi:hypothetical protein
MTEPPENILNHPNIKLEDVRDTWEGNECLGRGRSTAAGRGYNTERLASAVIGLRCWFVVIPTEDWYDTGTEIDEEWSARVECKSCIYRYPSGAYGRFRIWKHNHDRLIETAKDWGSDTLFLYFFVVYTVENDGVEREVGKVVAPVDLVDEVLDGWREMDHPTVGTRSVRDISWRLLFNRLGVSPSRLKSEDAVDLTSLMLSDSGDDM